MENSKSKSNYDTDAKIATEKELMDSPVYSEEKLNEVLEEIAKNITRECDRYNISLKELADITGIHYTHLYKITKHTGHIGLPALIKISYALKISPERLLPFEVIHRKTNGERFDEITRDLDIEDCNFLIKTVSDYAAHCRRVKFNANKNRSNNNI